ncbi:hemocyanin F chain [Nephila pilipes]|uniref:Hemocyanin F chain n=1 Tax=Nephila pilipes TaxID=299642 RepID=A0A8X6Q3Y2_NEPPI|nr:hemocyanin F chain [Nephila pilipes]
MDFILFAMLTSYENDRVYGPEDDSKCGSSPSYCGVKDRKYPDKRAMGYPFDREIKARSIEEFLLPNINLQKVKIQFKE